MSHADLPSPAELVQELGRLSREIDKALGFLHEQAHRYADAENTYRMARAKLHLSAEEWFSKRGNERPTVDDKRAYVDLNTAAERMEAHIAEAMKQAAVEAVRARRDQLSALQSAAAAVRSELEFARTVPR